MTRMEYEEIATRTQAMKPDEMKCVLRNTPDAYLLGELLFRYKQLLDTVSEYERVPQKINKVYAEMDFDDEVGWL